MDLWRAEDIYAVLPVTGDRPIYRTPWARDCETCWSRGIEATELTWNRCALQNARHLRKIGAVVLSLMERPRSCYSPDVTDGYTYFVRVARGRYAFTPFADNQNRLFYPDQCDTLRSPFCWRSSPLIITSVEQFLRADGVRFCDYCFQFYEFGE